MATRTDLAGLVAAPFWGLLWLFTAGRMGQRPPFERWRELGRFLTHAFAFRGHQPTSGGDSSQPPEGGSGVTPNEAESLPEPYHYYNEHEVLADALMGHGLPGEHSVPRPMVSISLRNGEAEDNNFFRAYAAIESMSLAQVRDNLLKLGRWPAERIVVRVLDWEEAVERLANDTQACLAMVRAVVAIEDADGRLYLSKTPELATGLRMDALKAMDEVEMEVAVREGYKIH